MATIKRQVSFDQDTLDRLDAYCHANPLLGARGRSRLINHIVDDFLKRVPAN